MIDVIRSLCFNRTLDDSRKEVIIERCIPSSLLVVFINVQELYKQNAGLYLIQSAVITDPPVPVRSSGAVVS
jgi:hypothetical protein